MRSHGSGEFTVGVFLATKIALVLPIVYFGAHRRWLRLYRPRYNSRHVYATGALRLRLPVRLELGFERSASPLPGVPRTGGPSRACRAILKNVPGMERHGNDVHRRPHIAACPRAANQLVQHATLDVPRSLVEIPVCRASARLNSATRAGRLLFRLSAIICRE